MIIVLIATRTAMGSLITHRLAGYASMAGDWTAAWCSAAREGVTANLASTKSWAA